MSESAIVKYVKDLTHFDPDFRMNAVRSLGEFYSYDVKRNALTQDEKNLIIDNLLKKLEPKETEEVKTITIRIFGNIAKYLKDDEIIRIFKIIIQYITDQKTVGRDIYLICAKSIFKEVSGSACFAVRKEILPSIKSGIASDSNEIKEVSFEIFNEYINTFNYVLIKETNSIFPDKGAICDSALESLKIEVDSLRKTLSKFLGNFSALLTDEQVNLLIGKILGLIQSSESSYESKIVYFSALNSIGKATASKNASLIEKILPFIFNFANENYLMENMIDYDKCNELAEACLNILETYILKNSASLRDSIEDIIGTALSLVQYDPNFSYDTVEDYDNEYNDYDAGYDAYAFADDSSWKVRRAATRVLSAIVKSRMEIEKHLTNAIIEKLVFCLREHEETSKEDIIACLCLYLRALTVDDQQQSQAADSMQEFGLVRQKSIALSIIPVIFGPLLENIKKILASGNNNILTGGLNLLSALSLPAAKELIIDLDSVKANVNEILKKNSSNFNLILFAFFNKLLKSVQYDENIIPHLDTFIAWMVQGIKNDFYKVNIESAHMAAQLVRILKESLSDDEIIPKLRAINSEILPKFVSNDLDQELKTSLITTVGNIILYTVRILDEPTLTKFFDVFLDKFKNENLTIICANWIMRILKSDQKIPLFNSILKKFIPIIIELINNKNPSLRHSAVEFLCCILQFYPKAAEGFEKTLVLNLLEYSNYEGFMQSLFETLLLILHNFDLEKELLLKTINESVKVLDSAQCALTEKAAESLLAYCASASSRLSSVELESLIKALLNFKGLSQSKSKLIAHYAKHAKNSEKLVKSLISDFNSLSKDNESRKNILLLIGDIALINGGSCAPAEIFELIANIFSAENDDLKAHAALALAKVGLQDPTHFLSAVKKLGDKESVRYGLSSIREFIHLICAKENSPLAEKNDNNALFSELFGILLNEISSQDEKIMKLCGECLGVLGGKSTDLLSKYINYLDDKNESIRAGFYYGLKSLNFISDENLLMQIFHKLVKGLSDESMVVKQNAYNSLICFSHDHPKNFKVLFAEIWHHFEADYMIKPALITEYDIGGGMRIKTDKGLPIRKAIYSTIKILLENIPEKINFEKALQMLLKGLEDDDDVSSISFGAIIKIVQLAPGSISSFVETLIDILRKKVELIKKTLTDKTADKKKFSFIVVSCQRLCNEFKKVQEIQENPKFIDFNQEVQSLNIA